MSWGWLADAASWLGGTLGSIMSMTGSPLGTIMGGMADYASNAVNSAKTNAYNQAMYEDAKNFISEREDLAWERDMQASNTQIQRLMADAKAAGVNPLAVVGQSATVPQASATGGASPKGYSGYTSQFASVAKAAFSEFSSLATSAMRLMV